MAQKAVFAEQAEQFVKVVRSVLQSEETRIEFAKAPLAVLEKAGIRFADSAVAKKVEAGLSALGADWTYQPPPDSTPEWEHWMVLVNRAVSVTWVAKPEGIEDVIQLDRPRVDAFTSRVALEAKVASLEQKVVALEAALASR